MKKMMLVLATVAVVASAEVVVRESVNPVTGMKTVMLAIQGNKPYSSLGTPAVLFIRCQQIRKYQKVELMLNTGVVTVNRYGLGLGDKIIETLIRFDEESRSRMLAWMQSEEPGTLIRNDFKFIRDQIFKSKLVHIEVSGFQTGSSVSSFDLTGLQEEYAKHQECKQQ